MSETNELLRELIGIQQRMEQRLADMTQRLSAGSATRLESVPLTTIPRENLEAHLRSEGEAKRRERRRGKG